jgi:hypothetical protein
LWGSTVNFDLGADGDAFHVTPCVTGSDASLSLVRCRREGCRSRCLRPF